MTLATTLQHGGWGCKCSFISCKASYSISKTRCPMRTAMILAGQAWVTGQKMCLHVNNDTCNVQMRADWTVIKRGRMRCRSMMADGKVTGQGWCNIINGKVRLVRLQTDNFGLFLRQQTDEWWNFRLHDKRINKNRLGFCFPFEIQHIYIL
jgi:hypothetical protein